MLFFSFISNSLPSNSENDFCCPVLKIKVILSAKALNEVESFDKYTTIIEKYLGKGKRVKDCDESQVDILGLILSDLNDLVKTLNIEG